MFTLLLFALLASASAEDIPDECSVLLSPTWTINVLVIELREPTPDEGPGIVAHVRTADGCGSEVIFHEPELTLAVGDLLEIHGMTENNEVYVEKVRRVIPGNAL